MNRTLRGVLFWSFIVFFLVAAPLSVLYTAGYRYNAKNGSLVRTGVISVTSTPRNAEIFLDGAFTDRTTPFLLKQILPGEYELRLERDGYHSWQGTVEVVSGATTNVQSVFLFRDEDPLQQFIKSAVALTPSPTGSAVAYLIREGGWEEIWLYTAGGAPRLVDRFSLNASLEGVDLVWSADGSRLLARNVGAGVVRLYNADGQTIDIDQTLFAGSSDVFWHPSNGQILYISTERELRQYDFSNQQIQIFDNEAVASVLIDASILTLTDNGTQVELHQTIGEERELIALLPRAEYTIEERDASYIILRDRRSNLILVDIRAEAPILLETNARVYDWHAGTDQLVYSDGNEVTIYSAQNHSQSFVTRQSEFIETLAWHPTGNHIMIATETSLSAIEAHRIADQRFITSLLETQDIETFWLTQDAKTAFFYGTVEGATGLYSLELTR